MTRAKQVWVNEGSDNMKYTQGLCILLIIGSMLTSCVRQEISPTPALGKTHFSSLTPPLTFTVTSSETVWPTFSPTPTAEPTQTVTLTPPATLESEQVEEYINHSLLEEPIECDAPCFWGILPGKTTFGEAENVFTRLELYPIFVVARGNKEYYSVIYDSDDRLNVVTDFTIQENIVKDLAIGITSKPKVSRSKEWIAYSLRTLIERYGAPSKLNFALDWGQESFFEMDMHFDKYDLIVQYLAYGYIERSFPRVCPLDIPFRSVSLWMGKDPSYPPADAVLLEKGTSLTLDGFAKLITGDANKACFMLKEEAFQ
jgi:hypothetical protein